MNRREFLSSSLAAAIAASDLRGWSQGVSDSLPETTRQILYVMADLTETDPAKQRSLVETLGPADSTC